VFARLLLDSGTSTRDITPPQSASLATQTVRP
jgi:hypothetical protein